MRVEFDPAKDEINQAKHGVALQAASSFDWDTRDYNRIGEVDAAQIQISHHPASMCRLAQCRDGKGDA